MAYTLIITTTATTEAVVLITSFSFVNKITPIRYNSLFYHNMLQYHNTIVVRTNLKSKSYNISDDP